MRTNSSQGNVLYLVALVLVGALLRLDFLYPIDFVIDADEAIVGLMAKHLLESGDVPTFYYGQHYMGSLEPLLVSAVFSIFGMSNEALKSVPFLFSLMLIPLMYFIGKVCGGERAGRIAALLTAVPPSALMVWSTKARGGFIELIVIGALSLLLLMRWCRSDGPQYARWFLITILLGLGWWVNNQIIYFMLPAAFAFGVRIIDEVWREGRWTLGTATLLFVTGCIGFFLGGLPYWIYNIENDFISLQMFGASGPRDVLKHFEGLFTVALPILLGGRRDWTLTDYLPGSALAACMLYGILAVILLVVRGKQLRGVFALRLDRAHPVELCWVLIVGAGAIFVVSSFGFLSQAPRYLLPTYVGIFPLAALAIVSIGEQSMLLSRIFTFAVLALNLLSCYAGGRAIPGEPFVAKGERVSRDHTELISWLEEHQIRWVKTNYWIGYRLAFETRERVRFLVFQQPLQRRIQRYEDEGRAEDMAAVPYVLVPSQAALVTRALDRMGYRYDRYERSGYVILSSLRPQFSAAPFLSSSELRARSNMNDAEAFKAIDGDRTTRWGAGAAQHPGMEYEVFLPPHTEISGLQVELAHWWHDYARGLTIEAVDASGNREVILSEGDYDAIRYTSESDGAFEIRFPNRGAASLRLVQRGAHPIFDWSIAELRVRGAMSVANRP